jgi:hypothetical protein
MKRTLLLLLLTAAGQLLLAQTKSTEQVEQLWLGYFNQSRLSNKWGIWTDLQLRTKDNFVDNLSQIILRPGITYYATDNTKLTIGYSYILIYPTDGHTEVTQPENRIWQQVQWHTNYRKNRMMQWIRLEERFRRKIANDTALGDGYNFNWRIRYNFWYEIPLVKNGSLPKSLSLIVNDEVHINFGSEIVNNYFDQNRFFLGLKYQISPSTNIQAGYTNVFQQLSAGNKYKSIDGIRVFLFQNIDLRPKKK